MTNCPKKYCYFQPAAKIGPSAGSPLYRHTESWCPGEASWTAGIEGSLRGASAGSRPPDVNVNAKKENQKKTEVKFRKILNKYKFWKQVSKTDYLYNQETKAHQASTNRAAVSGL